MFKVGDVVRLKDGGAVMTVSKLFRDSERREMAECTWLDKRGECRAAFAISSLEPAGHAKLRVSQGPHD
jgi:uncharacterized protein YodC (DUF2158 family)